MKTLAVYEETRTMDNNTGEVSKTTNTKTFKAEAEPKYIKMYLEDISYLNNLPKGSGSLIYELLKLVNYDQEIILTKYLKEKIAKNLDCKLKTINNKLCDLVKTEVLILIARGVYSINTNLFGKGSWKDIIKHRKSLKLEIFYNFQENNRIIKTAKEKK